MAVRMHWKRIALITLVVLAALWLWPLVGQAPWEHSSALCQDALLRRRAFLNENPNLILVRHAPSDSVSVATLQTLDSEVAELCSQYPFFSPPTIPEPTPTATPAAPRSIDALRAAGRAALEKKRRELQAMPPAIGEQWFVAGGKGSRQGYGILVRCQPQVGPYAVDQGTLVTIVNLATQCSPPWYKVKLPDGRLLWFTGDDLVLRP